MPDGGKAPPDMVSRDGLRRVDSTMVNLATGLGIEGVDTFTASARKFSYYSTARARLERRQSWAASREIMRPARDLTSKGVELRDLPEWASPTAILGYLAQIGHETATVPEDIGALNSLSRLYAEGNTDGGAALLIIFDDGLPSHMPVDMARIKSIRSLEILERDEITPMRTGDALRPEHYIIGTSRTAVTAASIVHRTRVIITLGTRLSPSEEFQCNGWGASVLELLQGERLAMHTAIAELSSVVLKATYDVVFIAELAEMMKNGHGHLIDERLAMYARARSQHRVMPMDGGRQGTADKPGRNPDRVESIGVRVDGYAKIATVTEGHWAAGTGQTPSIALGKTVGWGNGANAGDWQSWGSHMGGEMTRWLNPRFLILVYYAMAAQDGPTAGRQLGVDEDGAPEVVSIHNIPLWTPSEQEIEVTRAARTATDVAMQTATWVSAEQLRDQRLVQGSTGEISLDPVPDEDLEETEETDEGDAPPSLAPMPEDMIGVKDAAALAGVPTRTLTRLMETGDLPYWQFGARKVVSMAAVTEAGRVAPADEPVDGDGAPEVDPPEIEDPEVDELAADQRTA